MTARISLPHASQARATRIVDLAGGPAPKRGGLGATAITGDGRDDSGTGCRLLDIEAAAMPAPKPVNMLKNPAGDRLTPPWCEQAP